jgi:hypothetical protein
MTLREAKESAWGNSAENGRAASRGIPGNSAWLPALWEGSRAERQRVRFLTSAALPFDGDVDVVERDPLQIGIVLLLGRELRQRLLGHQVHCASASFLGRAREHQIGGRTNRVSSSGGSLAPAS